MGIQPRDWLFAGYIEKLFALRCNLFEHSVARKQRGFVFVLVRYIQVFDFVFNFGYALISYHLCASVSKLSLNLVTINPNSQQDEEGGWHT